MATMEEIVKQADLLGNRGEKREEYLKHEFKPLEERQAREKKEEAERQAREKKEEAERQERKEEVDRKERFERFAESNGWSRERWSSSLCALLTGRALDCYGRLSAEQPKDYDKVKEALMKRYDLTEDGYRRKFRTCKPAEGEAKTIVADQRSCFKCKKTGHITRYCTTVDSTTKKAGAGVVVKTTEVNTPEVRKPAESPTMEVMDDLQSEVEDGMLKLASGKSVLVMTNCAALRDPKKTRSLGLPV
ncbi:reverse transcriptase [Plakobranchus ocellatus]|uniref:Reverse transcriptase n=1 Tax=Plakobranchus ocellatus TaxID=259542 RepID=A0AAV4B9R1_9GAST|nr:reverse transcriptase [Plakobranchus ocellatus]